MEPLVQSFLKCGRVRRGTGSYDVNLVFLPQKTPSPEPKVTPEQFSIVLMGTISLHRAQRNWKK